MSSFLGQFALLASVGGVIFFISSLTAALAFWLHNKEYVKRSLSMHPFWLCVYSLSAAIITTVVALHLALPNSPRLPLVFEHCHNNTCAEHLPSVMNVSLLSAMAILVTLCVLGLIFLLLKWQQQKLNTYMESLMALSGTVPTNSASYDNLSNVTILNTQQPVLLNTGLLLPNIVISSAIAKALSSQDLKLIMAYEYSKAKWFENLTSKLVQIFCFCWPKQLKRAVLLSLQKAVQGQAYYEVSQLLGQQNSRVSNNLLSALPNNVADFIRNINAPIGKQANTHFTSKHIRLSSIVFASVYLILLLMFTSNATHLVLEWFQ